MHAFRSLVPCCGLTVALVVGSSGLAGCAASTPNAAPPASASSGASDPPALASGTRRITTELEALMPQGLTTMGAAALGDNLYIVGGYFGTPHEYSKEFQSGGVRRLALSTGTWETLADVEPIQSPALVAGGQHLYMVGGMHTTNSVGEPAQMHSLTRVSRFDPNANRWEKLTDLPEPRSSHAAVVVDQTLYVIGGWRLTGGMFDSEWSTTMLTADLSQPKLEWKATDLPFQTRAHGLVAFANKLYVLGGLTPKTESDEVHIYDLSAKTWSEGPSLPKGNMTIRGAVWHDQLYANGGDGNVYRLSSDGQSWQNAGTLAFPRMFHEIVWSERGPLVIGGVPSTADGARIRLIERLSDEDSQVAGVVWTLPGQSAAKNRQGTFLWGQQLYVFGGNNSLEQHDFKTENFVSTARRLDLGAFEWGPIPDFPAARQSMQTLVVGQDDKAVGLAIGGFGFSGDRLSTQKDVFTFDFAKAVWTPQPSQSLPEPRSQFGLAQWANAVWLFGGMNFDAGRGESDQFRLAANALKLDLAQTEAGFKDAGIALGEPRRAFAGALLDDHYYLTGGLKDDFTPVTSCEVVDLPNEKSGPMHCPTEHRLGGELVAIKGRLYLVGGSVAGEGGNRVPTSKIEVYEPAADRWSVVKAPVPLESPAHVRAFSFKDGLLLYSANRADGIVQVALLDIDALAADKTEFKHMNVPVPLTAKP
jgi:hypothetical protein